MKTKLLILLSAISLIIACKKEEKTEPKPVDNNYIEGTFVQYENYQRKEYHNGVVYLDTVIKIDYPSDTLTFYANGSFFRPIFGTTTYTYNINTKEIVLSDFGVPSSVNPTMYLNVSQLPYTLAINVPSTSQSGDVIYWNTKDSSGTFMIYYQRQYKRK